MAPTGGSPTRDRSTRCAGRPHATRWSCSDRRSGWRASANARPRPATGCSSTRARTGAGAGATCVRAATGPRPAGTMRGAPDRPERPSGERRRRHAPQRRDHARAVLLELPLLVAAHEVEVELGGPRLGERVELLDMLADLAAHAEAIDRLVVDESRVGRSRLGVMPVVVPRPVADVAGEVGRQSLLAVTADQVDH